jgi:enamine deaminase RidA (YjgF/YER057c/UK114 family)
MQTRIVETPSGMCTPVGEYSYAVVSPPGRTVFVSGLASLDENGKVLGEGDMGAQAAQAFRRLGIVLKDAGGSFENVVRLSVYVTTFTDLHTFSDLMREHFPSGRYPASTLLQVQGLAHKEMLIEIEATAVLDA